MSNEEKRKMENTSTQQTAQSVLSSSKATNDFLTVGSDLTRLMETDPKYSLEVDPTNKYGFTNIKKACIAAYVQYRNIAYCARLCNIPEEECQKYLIEPEVRSELDRINHALYQRQITRRMLTIDEIGGYLSSLIVDETFEADRLSPRDKLSAIRVLIDVTKTKNSMIANGGGNVVYDVEPDVEKMDVNQIKDVIKTIQQSKVSPDEHEQKVDLIKSILQSQPSLSDEAYLQTLSIADLMALEKEVNSNDGTPDKNQDIPAGRCDEGNSSANNG